jgi:hypothetical protein
VRRTVAWLSAALYLGSGAAWAAKLTKAEYTRLVGRAADGLKQAAAAQEHRQRLAAAAIELLPEEADVAVASGAPPLKADNRELRATLSRMAKRGPEGMSEAAELLGNLQHGLAVDEVSRPGSAQPVLAEVLARREFRPGLAYRLRAWLYRQALQLLDWLVRHFPSLDLDRAGKVARFLGWTIVAVVAGIVLYLIVRVTGLFTWGSRRQEEAAPAPPEVVRTRTQAEWLAAVEAAVARGDYRSALRALHMAALVRLDELGVVPFDRAATDGHFVHQLRRRGHEAAATALVGLNRLFALAWYGGRPTGATEYGAAQAQWRELEARTAP